MKLLPLGLLLSSLLLVGSAEPSSAASCSSRISPLRCLFASLHDLGSPHRETVARRHAARPKHIATVKTARTRRRGHVLLAAHGRHGRTRLASPAVGEGAKPTSLAANPVEDHAPLPARDAAAADETFAAVDKGPAAPGSGEAADGSGARAEPQAPDASPQVAEAAAFEPASPAAEPEPILSRDEVAPATRSERDPPRQPDHASSIRGLFGLSDAPPQAELSTIVGAVADPGAELKPLPEAFLELRPYFAELRYYVADDRVILVLPETRLIVMTY